MFCKFDYKSTICPWVQSLGENLIDWGKLKGSLFFILISNQVHFKGKLRRVGIFCFMQTKSFGLLILFRRSILRRTPTKDLLIFNINGAKQNIFWGN